MFTPRLHVYEYLSDKEERVHREVGAHPGFTLMALARGAQHPGLQITEQPLSRGAGFTPEVPGGFTPASRLSARLSAPPLPDSEGAMLEKLGFYYVLRK